MNGRETGLGLFAFVQLRVECALAAPINMDAARALTPPRPKWCTKVYADVRTPEKPLCDT